MKYILSICQNYVITGTHSALNFTEQRQYQNQLFAETVNTAEHAQHIQNTCQKIETLQKETELLKKMIIFKKQLKKLKMQKKQNNVC